MPPGRALWLIALLLIPAGCLQAAEIFSLTGPGLREGGTLPMAQVLNRFGCAGGNRSPALAWTAPPAATRSLAVTLFDPDARAGGGWWHWTVFNLPPQTQSLPEGTGSLPPGAVQGHTDFGTSGYGGACPPPGDPPHHYIFTVWALDIDRLKLDESAPAAEISTALHQHAIGQAVLTMRYGR